MFLTVRCRVNPFRRTAETFFNRDFAVCLAARLGMFLFSAALDPGCGRLSGEILIVADKTF
ncbi:MAG: hypothetical protein LBQ79_01095 [Deltaproteobacteria bacterium]|nr:hypothetical protein [Deltaproteobacteria bacterium]